MSEEVKTISLLAAALVVGIAGYAVSREAPERTADADVGKPFVRIEDPLEVSRLKIVKYDENEGEPQPFEVALTENGSEIPSHENYPADALQHLVDAVSSVNDLEIVAVATESPAQHEEFGVLDPSDEALGRGATGVGTRVTMSDTKSEVLADFIIGKSVTEEGGQFYVRHTGNVRETGKDYVYVVELDPENLSTKFEDWIERDLLKFDPLDLARVRIDDYSLVKQERLNIQQGRIELAVGQNKKSMMELEHDQQELAWNLKKLEVFDKDGSKEVTLAEDEELNKATLDDLKTALDDLEIVDVRRKTAALKGNLKETLAKAPQIFEDLQRRGFFLFDAEKAGDDIQVLSDNGEIVVGMSNGLEYVMRFGEIAGVDKAEDANEAGDDPAAEDPEDAAGEDKAGKALRYLWVTARLNDQLIPKPELDEVPPETPPADSPDSKDANPDGTESPKDAGEPDGAVKPEDAASPDAAEKPDGPGDTDSGDAADKLDAGEGDAAPDAADQTGTDCQEEAAADGDDNENAEVADPAAEPAEPATDAANDDAQKQLDEWKQRRDEIIADNEQREKEYKQKIEDAKKKVDELNERFSDWYYVINDATYDKIHLSSSDVIKKKEKEGEEGGGVNGAGEEDAADKTSIEKFNDLKEAAPAPK